jgi:hypothetical protein
MFMYNKFKYFREVDKGRNGSVITNKGTVAFRTGTEAACFLVVGKCCSDSRRIICFSTDGKMTEKPFIIKPGMS